jgi:UDP-N-acetylglucosamine diphosphorylase/glucosamine-1-phosphate N-acetyltransferase
MLEVVLYDRASWREHLLPLVYTRPVGDLRVGILTFHEKWQLLMQSPVTFYTETYLQKKFVPPGSGSLFLVLRANLCPSVALVQALVDLKEGCVLKQGEDWLAYKVNKWHDDTIVPQLEVVGFQGEVEQVRYLEDIFLKNAAQLRFDYHLLTEGRESAVLDTSNTVIGDLLFAEEDVEARCCTFNTLGGPIYIGKGAVLEEGALLKGSIAIGKGARVKMGSRLYPNVTIGPKATVGGEVNNTVMWGDCAKGHDGYLGCAVIGEGCNIGAGSSNSNLQNNWGTVDIYDYHLREWRHTGAHKVGTFMGDFSMCGINSSITTGCVVGVGAQVAMSNIIPKFVADFSWLTDQKRERYNWEKFRAMLRARAMLGNERLREADIDILADVYRITARHNEEIKSTK